MSIKLEDLETLFKQHEDDERQALAERRLELAERRQALAELKYQDQKAKTQNKDQTPKKERASVIGWGASFAFGCLVFAISIIIYIAIIRQR